MAHSHKSKQRVRKAKAKRVPSTQADASVYTMSSAGFDAFVALVCNPPELSSAAQARCARKWVWE